MKNTFAILASCVLLFAVLGCNTLNPFTESSNTTANTQPTNTRATNSVQGNTPPANKSTVDKTIDSVVNTDSTGVPECDQLLETLAEMAKPSADEGYAEKIARELFLNKIRSTVKQKIDENINDKVALAKDCKEIKMQVDNYNNSGK